MSIKIIVPSPKIQVMVGDHLPPSIVTPSLFLGKPKSFITVQIYQNVLNRITHHSFMIIFRYHFKEDYEIIIIC